MIQVVANSTFKSSIRLSTACSACVKIQNFHQSNNLPREALEDDYQYLQRSNVPTYKFQRSLMRLPIPELEKTCSRYLRSQQVILDDSEYNATKSFVAEFQTGVGQRLHQDLKAWDKRNKSTSYISGHWFNMYLSDRAPLPLNYNPFMAFKPDERPGYSDPIIRASNILVSSMRFMKSLRELVLEPEVYHLNAAKSDNEAYRKVIKWSPEIIASLVSMVYQAFPLDMSQFENLFNSSRIPQIRTDTIKADSSATHMLFMKRGNFYVFELFDKDGNIYSPEHIHACVSYIYNDDSPMPEFPIGSLTSENRDTWAKAREDLVSAGNEIALNLIDTAAFNMVFDDEPVGMDPEKCYRQFLYGDCANRWYDKSFSLFFTSDGMTALNFEHAWGDGVAVMRYFNEISKDTKTGRINPDSQPANVDASTFVTKLEFNIPPSVENAITKARESHQRITSQLGVDLINMDIFGKNFCKSHKVSPDAIMQLGIQYAYYLLTGKTTATYESCSTSAFKHGRTETIRPMTLETKRFVEAAVNGTESAHVLQNLIKEASKMHGKLTIEAAKGQGFDRHLFSLRKRSEEEVGVQPGIFSDPAYAKINHTILSTSTLPSTEIIFGGFGPVVQDGFGIGYQIQDDNLGMIVSTYPPHADGKGLMDCAAKAYQDIRSILTTK